MKKIYILSGVSGVGKTTLISNTFLPNGECHLVHKYTSRPVRPNEVNNAFRDNEGGQSAEFVRGLDWVYTWGEHLYGIKKQELDGALKEHDNIMITIKDAKTIKALSDCYRKQGVRVAALFVCPYITDNEVLDEVFGSSAEFLEHNMQKDNRTAAERESRLTAIAEEYEKIWRGNEHVFDHVLMVFPDERYSLMPAVEYAMFFDSAIACEDYKPIGAALTKLEYGKPSPDERKAILPLLKSFTASPLPSNQCNVRNLSLFLRAKRQLDMNR